MFVHVCGLWLREDLWKRQCRFWPIPCLENWSPCAASARLVAAGRSVALAPFEESHCFDLMFGDVRSLCTVLRFSVCIELSNTRTCFFGRFPWPDGCMCACMCNIAVCLCESAWANVDLHMRRMSLFIFDATTQRLCCVSLHRELFDASSKHNSSEISCSNFAAAPVRKSALVD